MFGLKRFPRVARATLLSLFSLLLVLQAASCAPSAGGESSVNVPDNASGSTPEGQSDEPHGQEGFMEEGFVMEKDGVLFCDVVIPDSAGEKETAAAGDLRKYIGKMTGETPKIVRESKISDGKKHIFVGGTARAAELGIEKPSGYPGVERVLVLQRENDLFVLGNDDGNYNGTQFAVNMLLEHLGCGWFGEGEMWEIVPELKDIDLTGLEIDHSPRFNSRITRVFGGQWKVADKWYLGGNKSLTGHWLFQIAPASMYAEHPDWYALNEKGTRDPAGLDYFQFCYSNEEFADYVAEKLKAYFADRPDLVSMTIAYNDGWDEHYCNCESCAALGNQSDVLVAFANRVAKKVYPSFPDRTLQIYSYHMTYKPPQNSVPLEPNVELMLCRETSLTRPLDANEYRPGYDKITRNTYDRSWKENAEEWIAKAQPQHISVWEWYCIAAGDKNWADIPWVQGDVATRNQDLWEKLGVEYIFYDQGPADGYYEDETSFALRWPLWYVASRAMWGTDKTGSELLRDACEKLFGAAGEAMLNYYLKLADISEHSTEYSITWVPADVKKFYGPYLEELTSLVKEIRAAAAGCTNIEKERVRVQLGYWAKLANKLL
ncbi:MAG: DUF4838 domain-containing protein [Clostridia bacterium]|nr:DUF4838 domain-containing protein [Clostridia bacterium]